ncbi:MAG: MFS transporter, partial [Candidatus Heimdallarchaeaceae archaeon]
SFAVPPFNDANIVMFSKTFHGWRFAFLFGGLAIFSALFIHFLVPESKAWERAKYLESTEEKAVSLDFKVFEELFSKKLRGTFILGLLFGITGMMTFYAINSWLPEYFQINGVKLKDSALMIGLFWGTTGYIGHVLFGFISNAIGRRKTFVGYSFLVVLSGIIMYLWVTETWAKYLGLALFTFGCGYFSSFGAVFGEIYPTEVRSTAASISYNGARGFSLIAPPLVIWVGEIFNNMGAGLMVGGFFVILSSIILFMLPTKEGQDIT